MVQPERIKIKYLAEQMIKLSGKSIDEVGIVYTGLRPGEKLYEELFYPFETLLPTSHEKLMVTMKSSLDWDRVATLFESLSMHAEQKNDDSIREIFQEIILECQDKMLNVYA